MTYFIILAIILLGAGAFYFFYWKKKKANSPATSPAIPTEWYNKRLLEFAAEGFSTGGTMFIGDSNTEFWKITDYLTSRKIKNRGIAGDCTDGVLMRLNLHISEQPEKVFLMIGSNDLNQCALRSNLIEKYGQIINMLLSSLPNLKLFCISIPPVNFEDFGLITETSEINNDIINITNLQIQDLINKHYPQVTYINMNSEVKDVNGRFKKELTQDGLHFNEAGYGVFIKILEPYL